MIAALARHGGRGPGSIRHGSSPLPSSHLISMTHKSRSQRVKIISTPRYRGMKADEWRNQAKSCTSESGWMQNLTPRSQPITGVLLRTPALRPRETRPRRSCSERFSHSGGCSHRRCSGLARRGHRGLSPASADSADIHFATGGREGHVEGSRVTPGHSTVPSRF
jgi:hypothetical protein